VDSEPRFHGKLKAICDRFQRIFRGDEPAVGHTGSQSAEALGEQGGDRAEAVCRGK
jgi:hypothetical protein